MRTIKQRITHYASCTVWLLILFFWLAVVASYADAKVARDYTQVHKFRKANLCPATKKVSGPCGDWVVDHKMPLCAGGADSLENMQWQRYRASKLKDKEEIALCNYMRKNNILLIQGMETLCKLGKERGWTQLYSLHCQSPDTSVLKTK